MLTLISSKLLLFVIGIIIGYFAVCVFDMFTGSARWLVGVVQTRVCRKDN